MNKRLLKIPQKKYWIHVHVQRFWLCSIISFDKSTNPTVCKEFCIGNIKIHACGSCQCVRNTCSLGVYRGDHNSFLKKFGLNIVNFHRLVLLFYA